MMGELKCAFCLSEDEEVQAVTVHRGHAVCLEHFREFEQSFEALVEKRAREELRKWERKEQRRRRGSLGGL